MMNRGEDYFGYTSYSVRCQRLEIHWVGILIHFVGDTSFRARHHPFRLWMPRVASVVS